MRRPAAKRCAAALLVAACTLGAACSSGGLEGGTAVPTTTGASTTVASTTTAATTTTSTTAAPSTTTSTSSTSTTTTTTTTLPQGPAIRAITAEAPLRVWVIGDSLAGPVGNALALRASATGVVATTIDYLSGSGLASPRFYDWPEFVAWRQPQVAPDVVVTVIGANDGQGMYGPDGWVEFGTPQWDAAYAAVVGGFMDLLASASTRVYWVGMPIMAGPNYDGEIRHMNAIHREQAALRPAVAYVEAYALFQGEDGGYAASLPDADGNLVTMRDPDGIHYSRAGADRMARVVLAVIAAGWGFLDLLQG